MMPNQTLGDAARVAVSDPRFEQGRGFCERFAREVIQEIYGNDFDDMFKATARLTAFAWQSSGLATTLGAVGGVAGLEVGDVLYKTNGAGPDGHVGILVDGVDSVGGVPNATGLAVAENSSTTIGRVQGAKGFRTLPQWGNIDVIVRLADPVDRLTIAVQGAPGFPGFLDGGTTLCPVREWGEVLGFNTVYDPVTRRVSFDGQLFDEPLRMIGGHGYAPVRDLAAAAGLNTVVFDEANRLVTVNP